MKYKLLYIPEEAEDVVTYYGFNEVSGIEHYKGAVLRDKAVFRVDLFGALKDWFCEEILYEYRSLIYNIISGRLRNKKVVSEVFTILYKEDIRFRRFLGELVYFNENLEQMSLYQVCVEIIQSQLREQKEFVVAELERKNIKVIADSSCYLYAAITDRNITVTLPKGYRGEVISHAKAWKGLFKESQ